MNNSFINLIAIQVRELFREPEVLFWSVVFPVVLSGVLGLAFSQQEGTSNKVAIVQNTYTDNHTLVALFKANPKDSLTHSNFNYIFLPKDKAFLSLKRGEVQLIVEPVVNNNIIYHFDPKNEAAQLQYLQLEKKIHKTDIAVATIKPVLTQGSRYIDFLIPGMLALGIMNSCIWGIGWSLIELRIKKLLRRMVATPMNKTEFLLAQLITRLLLTLFESSLLIVFAYFIFDVHIKGSLFSVLLMFMAGITAFGGIAVLVASRPEKTQVGSGIINFITLSLTILSGIFFSYTNFPGWAAHIIQYMPLTLLADSLRSIFNEGAPLTQVLSKAILLMVYGASCFFAGLRVFKWY